MDAPGFRQRKSVSQKKRNNRGAAGPRPPLFEDTSGQQQQPYGYAADQVYYSDQYPQEVYYSDQYPPGGYPMAYGPPQYGPQPTMSFPGEQILNDPMASMAVQYGSSLAGQGKEYMHKNLEKYVSATKLKYYFAVDTNYVAKKLALIFFPFTHSDWSIRFNHDEPVAPRDEINAPDLYIPVMALVTYILTTGVVMGVQNRFTPEQLGIQTSTALVWLVLELFLIMLSLYILSVNTDLKYMDILAYSGYKYIGMIGILVAGLLFKHTGFYLVLLWFSFSTAYFLLKTLRVQILPHTDSDGFTRGSKRSLYLILSIALLQPVLMWWLTFWVMFPR